MPSNIDKMKLPKGTDRRVKLTDKDRADIKQLYYEEHLYIRAIARLYADKCSRRLIVYTLFPERLKALQEKHKAEKHHLKYYNRAKHTQAMRRHRKHKRKVLGLKPTAIDKITKDNYA